MASVSKQSLVPVTQHKAVVPPLTEFAAGTLKGAPLQTFQIIVPFSPLNTSECKSKKLLKTNLHWQAWSQLS